MTVRARHHLLSLPCSVSSQQLLASTSSSSVSSRPMCSGNHILLSQNYLTPSHTIQGPRHGYACILLRHQSNITEFPHQHQPPRCLRPANLDLLSAHHLGLISSDEWLETSGNNGEGTDSGEGEDAARTFRSREPTRDGRCRAAEVRRGVPRMSGSRELGVERAK